MRFSHTNPVAAASFDDPNLIAAAGVVPVMGLATSCSLADLADEWLTIPTDKGAHPGAKVSALVTGMVMGADSIADMGVLRHGAMGTLFDRTYAPSTLGSFLRMFTYGHTRQLDAVATRFLGELTRQTSL
ncbi:IS1380 family transposase, partial [Gordonia amicalis]